MEHMNENKARTGLRFGYPDGYYRCAYPGLYSTPKSASAALDLEMEEDAPMGQEQPDGMPRVVNHPGRFREWLQKRTAEGQ